MILNTYNLQVFSPGAEEGPPENMREHVDTRNRVLSNLPAILEAVEEDLTSLLPEGYSAKITEWCEED